MGTALKRTPAMYNLAMSEGVVPLYEAVKNFIANEIDPITEEFYRLGKNRKEHWGYGEGQLDQSVDHRHERQERYDRKQSRHTR